jgi:hypothetical protein
MRRILWAAVMGVMTWPAVSYGGNPYANPYVPGYVYYSAKHGHACPYGYRSFGFRQSGRYVAAPPLGQVWGPTTIVAGSGYCVAGNGFPQSARSHAAPVQKGVPETVVPQAKLTPRVGTSAAAKSSFVK